MTVDLMDASADREFGTNSDGLGSVRLLRLHLIASDGVWEEY